MDILTWLAEHAEIIAWAAPALCTLVLLWLSLHFVRRADFEKYKQEAKTVDDDQDRRIAMEDAARVLFEQRLASLPTAEDMHGIKVELTRMSGEIKALQVQMDGQQDVLNIVRHQSERMNSFLMERGAAR
ncbi:MAG: DUF2730 domain-containing protein [Desulfovibrio sp.]|jgi:hypothetical protein|nr:DUF2730 domain-containing protein [Desulfovibrio sp.]